MSHASNGLWDNINKTNLPPHEGEHRKLNTNDSIGFPMKANTPVVLTASFIIDLKKLTHTGGGILKKIFSVQENE